MLLSLHHSGPTAGRIDLASESAGMSTYLNMVMEHGQENPNYRILVLDQTVMAPSCSDEQDVMHVLQYSKQVGNRTKGEQMLRSYFQIPKFKKFKGSRSCVAQEGACGCRYF